MYNTGNSIPSAALEDMADNAHVLDQLVNKTDGNVTDRTGTVRRSFQQIIMDMGFEPLAGSFQAGATLTQRNQVLQDETTGVFYSWNGALPKVVSAGSTPATSGAIGAGAWVDRTDETLRTDLASTSGSDLVGFLRDGASAIATTVQDALRHQAVNMLEFYANSDGNDYYPALSRAIAAIRSNLTKSRVLLIPYTATFWPVSQTVLFNLSNFTLLLHGNVKLTSTARQKTLLFAYDTLPQPAQLLTNITVIGNGSTVDGNGSAMTFTYAHGDGSDNDSSIRFNYIQGLYVENVVADNGPIDSFSIRRCQKWTVTNCEFKNSKEDNGFSATTDFGTYKRGDWTTYGYGWVVNCVGHDNTDFGMTAYNCSGVKFIGCRSYANSGGYSYEDNFGSPNIKVFDGLFDDCVAFNNTTDNAAARGCGFYVDASGVTINDDCRSYGNSYSGTDTNNLYGHGVLISTANNVKIGGDHRYNQKAGLAIYNGATMQMDITVSGIYNSNGWHGIHARGVAQLIIKPGTECRFNGLSLVNGFYGRGINVDNSGELYLQGTGLLQIQSPVISNNGIGAIYSNYVKTVFIDGVVGSDNLTMGYDIGVDVHNATTAALSNNKMFAGSTAQKFAYAIEASVNNGYDINNIGDGLSGVSTNLASDIKQYARGELIGSSTYNVPSLSAGEVVVTTVPVIGAALGDFATSSFGVDISGITLAAWVSDTNVVSVRIKNESAGTIDLNSTTIRALVIKRNAG